MDIVLVCDDGAHVTDDDACAEKTKNDPSLSLSIGLLVKLLFKRSLIYGELPIKNLKL